MVDYEKLGLTTCMSCKQKPIKLNGLCTDCYLNHNSFLPPIELIEIYWKQLILAGIAAIAAMWYMGFFG